RPMPLAAPVTMATRSCSRFMFFDLITRLGRKCLNLCRVDFDSQAVVTRHMNLTVLETNRFPGWMNGVIERAKNVHRKFVDLDIRACCGQVAHGAGADVPF